jgi:hypothetical protein
VTPKNRPPGGEVHSVPNEPRASPPTSLCSSSKCSSLRRWLAPTGPVNQASATPDLHRVLLDVLQDALRFNDCERVIGRIYVDLLAKTVSSSKDMQS